MHVLTKGNDTAVETVFIESGCGFQDSSGHIERSSSGSTGTIKNSCPFQYLIVDITTNLSIANEVAVDLLARGRHTNRRVNPCSLRRGDDVLEASDVQRDTLMFEGALKVEELSVDRQPC